MSDERMAIHAHIDGIAISFDLGYYSVFKDRVFIEGEIRARGLKRISLGIGANQWSDLGSTSFCEVVKFDQNQRATLFPPRLKLRFHDGREIIFDKLTDERLGAETFWQVLNPAIEAMRARTGTGRLLEIGSRARSGVSRRNLFTFPGWQYVGFDVIAGENVDQVGDAHDLATYFPADHFDGVVALAVLEHILMPWKLMLDLNRVMRLGAIGAFITHQAYPVHDAPWDFWRFTDRAWQGLINPATGFEIIDAKMAEPAYLVAKYGHAAVDHNDYMSYQSSSVSFRKVGDTKLKWNVKVRDITRTVYPEK